MRVAAVVLAAGAGARLGGVAKALLRTAGGESFLAAVHHAAGAAGVSDLVVVLGPPHDEVTRQEAERLGLAWVENPQPERGMASSVEIGFGHALRSFAAAQGALLWPVDHARVQQETVRALVALADEDGAAQLFVPRYRGRGGHPALVARALWPALAACSGEPEGARSVFRAHAERVRWLESDDAGVVADVDRPEDLP